MVQRRGNNKIVNTIKELHIDGIGKGVRRGRVEKVISSYSMEIWKYVEIERNAYG